MDNRDEVREEVVKSLPKFPHGMLLLSPRTGKTPIAINIIKRANPKNVLWITPSKILANDFIPRDFFKWDFGEYIEEGKLTTVTYASLSKLEGSFETIIMDEMQYLTPNNIQNLLNGKIKYKNIIGMTGTPSKSKEKMDLYTQLNLPVLYRLSIKEATERELISDYEINVIGLEMSMKNNIHKKTKKFDYFTSEVKEYLYWDNRCEFAKINSPQSYKFHLLRRMRLIYDSPTKEEAAKELIYSLEGRKLIFCGSIAQADRLSPYRFHSKCSNEDFIKFQRRKINELALVKAGGVGATYEDIDHLILVQIDSDINGYSVQRIMRAMLLKLDHKVQIWVLCLNKTQDEVWVKKALSSFDDSKIKYRQWTLAKVLLRP